MFSAARGDAARRCISAPLRSSVRASAKRRRRACARPRPLCPMSGSMMSPTALTATIAATTRPLGMRSAALPRPPFIERARSAHLADRRAGAGADRALRHRRVRSPSRRPCSRSRRPGWFFALSPTGRSNRIAAGTIGTLAIRTSQPMWCSSSHFDSAGRRVETERAAAGQHDRVDLVDHVERVEQIGFARARRAAALATRRRGRLRRRRGSRCSRSVPPGSVKLPTLMPSTAVKVPLGADAP